MPYCRNCGEKLTDGTSFCPKCGSPQQDNTPKTVFCKHCGSEIDSDCIICPKCGKQVQELRSTPAAAPVVINNANQNMSTNTVVVDGRAKDKWVAFFLCLLLGYLGAHKFYEGRTGQGILYLLTLGLFGIGWIMDCIILLFKPNPYYV